MARPRIRPLGYKKEYDRLYYKKNKTKKDTANRKWESNNQEKHKKYQKKYRDVHKEKARNYNINYRKSYPDKIKKLRKMWYLLIKNNPVYVKKIRARAKSIRLFKKTKPCQVCGKKHKVQRHHQDYDKPEQIIFLCLQHHRLIHKNMARATSKNVHRNSTRLKSNQRAFRQSMQRNYNKKVVNKDQLNLFKTKHEQI